MYSFFFPVVAILSLRLESLEDVLPYPGLPLVSKYLCGGFWVWLSMLSGRCVARLSLATSPL